MSHNRTSNDIVAIRNELTNDILSTYFPNEERRIHEEAFPFGLGTSIRFPKWFHVSRQNYDVVSITSGGNFEVIVYPYTSLEIADKKREWMDYKNISNMDNPSITKKFYEDFDTLGKRLTLNIYNYQADRYGRRLMYNEDLIKKINDASLEQREINAKNPENPDLDLEGERRRLEEEQRRALEEAQRNAIVHHEGMIDEEDQPQPAPQARSKQPKTPERQITTQPKTPPAPKKPPISSRQQEIEAEKAREAYNRELKELEEEAKEDEYEQQLKDLIPPDKIKEVYKTIHKTLKDQDGLVQIYDADLNPVASANTKASALSELVKHLRNDISTDEKKVHSIGNRYAKGKSFVITELRKTKDNKPELYSTYVSLLNNYDMKTDKGKRMIYKLKDLYERGFNSDDLKQFAKEALEERMQRPYDIDTKSKKKINVKKYDMKDISKLKEYAKKYFS